ncbi:MAG: PASTA domain-containing protein [Bdellovibrionota bacterium]
MKLKSIFFTLIVLFPALLFAQEGALENEPYIEENDNVQFIIDEVEYVDSDEEFTTEPAVARNDSGIDDFIVTNAGSAFLGGRPQKIKRIVVIKEFKQGDVYYYKLKVIVERASADTNGKYPILKAKRYRDAIAKVAGFDKGIVNTLNLFLPKSIDTAKFPTLFMNYDYNLLIAGKGPNFDGKKSRNPKGKNAFVERIQYGFQPQTYSMILESCVEVDPSHPFAKVYRVADWYTFLTSLPVQAAKYLTKSGLTQTVLKNVILNAATCTRTSVQFKVLAKVPDLEGMKPSRAAQELTARNLKVQFVKKSRKNGKNKVTKQSVKPGKKVQAGTLVKVTYTVKEKEPDDEIDVVLGLWRFDSNGAEFRIIRGNGGFKCNLTKAVGQFKQGENFCRGMTPVINNKWVGEQKIKQNGSLLRWDPWTITLIDKNTFKTSGNPATFFRRIG